MKTNTKILVYSGIAIGLTAVIIIVYKLNKSGRLSRMGAFANKLSSLARSEYEHWGNGTIKEGDPRTMERLTAYWKEGADVDNWTDKQMINEAWSAAFISFLMRQAGAGTDFKYSASHSTYIVDSIKNKKQNNDKPFKGYKPNEVKVEVGDLVGFARQNGVNYDTTGAYKSHTDLVIGVSNGYAETIGGNVSNSVTITKVPLTSDGKIDSAKAPKYFVVIKNEK